MTSIRFSELFNHSAGADARGRAVRIPVVPDTGAVTADATLRGLVFEAPVVLDGLEIEGSCRFEDCVFQAGLVLRRGRIAGDFALLRCTIGGGHSQGVLDLAGTTIGGRVETQALTVQGAANLDFVTVRADCTLELAQIAGDLRLRGLEVRGDLRVTAPVDGAAADSARCAVRIQGALSMARARVDGGMELRCLSVAGDVDLRGITVGLTLSIIGDGGEVSGSQQLLEVGGRLSLEAAQVGQNLVLFDLATSEIGLATAHIADQLAVGDLEVSTFNAGSMHAGSVDWRSSVGVVYFDQAEIRSNFYGQVHAHRVSLWGARVHNLILDLATERCSLSHLQATTVQLFGLSPGKRELLSRLWDLPPEPGGFQFDGIAADAVELTGIFRQPVVLDGLQCARLAVGRRGETSKFPRGLRMRDAQVAGRVDFGDVAIGAGGLDLGTSRIGTELVLGNCDIAGVLDLSDTEIGRAVDCRGGVRCAQARLVGTRCDGDLRVAELALAPNGELEPALLARELTVRGRLEFAALRDDGTVANVARIPGTLDLAGSTLGHLVLSGHGLGGLQDEEQGPVTLERARIGRLQVLDPLPRAIDLSSIQVDRWDLPRDDYEGLLERMPVLKASVYAAIEASLVNQGETELAARVYRAMRWRAARNRSHPWRGRWAWVLGVTTGFGTQSWRVAWMLLALFLLSTWLMYSPANIMPSESALEVLAERVSPETRPEAWTLGSSAWLALRYTVPIIPVFAEWEWMAADRPLAITGTGFQSWLLSAEDFAMIASLFSWALWPLYLASVSGFLRRRG